MDGWIIHNSVSFRPLSVKYNKTRKS